MPDDAKKRFGLCRKGQAAHVCHDAPECDLDPNSRNNGVVGSLGGGTDTTNTRSPSLLGHG